MDEHDGDRTSPNLGAEEHTPIGMSPFDSIAGSLNRAVAYIASLAGSMPGDGDSRRERHYEALELALGIAGDLCHDTRRATAARRREEFPS
jgi:hypothetical protein